MTTAWTGLRQTLGALFFAALFLAAIPGAASAIEIPAKPRPDEPPRGAVLSGQAAFELMQGTYWEPGPLTVWEPGPADIARLEELFPAFMAGQKTRPDYQPLHEYYRQYAGVIRNGKKIICVNLFHYTFVQEGLKDPRRAEDFWKIDPIFVSDGGSYFFMVLFDLETGTFHSLIFNGYA